MKEEDEIKKAAAIQVAMETGQIAPSRVQKVVTDAGGKAVSFTNVSPAVVAAATGLRKARSEAGMSQRDFAEILGVPLSTYRNYEQYITFTPKTVRKLAVLAAANPESVRAIVF